MSRIVLDDATFDNLLAAGEVVEVERRTGGKTARFIWKPTLQQMIEFVGPENWPSDEELDRIERESPRYTTQQVMEHLRGLSK